MVVRYASGSGLCTEIMSPHTMASKSAVMEKRFRAVSTAYVGVVAPPAEPLDEADCAVERLASGLEVRAFPPIGIALEDLEGIELDAAAFEDHAHGREERGKVGAGDMVELVVVDDAAVGTDELLEMRVLDGLGVDDRAIHIEQNRLYVLRPTHSMPPYLEGSIFA